MIRAAVATISKPQGRHPVEFQLDIDWIGERDEERVGLGLRAARGTTISPPPPAPAKSCYGRWEIVCGNTNTIPKATCDEGMPLPEARRLAAEWLRSAIEVIARQDAEWLREEVAARALAGFDERLELNDALALLASEAGGPRWSGPPLDGYEAAARVAATSGLPLAEAIELAEQRIDAPELPRLTPAETAHAQTVVAFDRAAFDRAAERAARQRTNPWPERALTEPPRRITRKKKEDPSGEALERQSVGKKMRRLLEKETCP